MEPRKHAILDALTRFINQRSRIAFGNYGDVKAFRAEQRSIYNDLKQARVLLAAVKYADGIRADALIKAAQGAYSGRLIIVEDGPLLGAHIDYCTGQYFPTEYRRAVCAVLASALWDHVRTCCMPKPIGYRAESWAQLGKGRQYGVMFGVRAEAEESLAVLGGSDWGHVNEVYDMRGNSAGDWLRAHFRKEFGRSIAARWFS